VSREGLRVREVSIAEGNRLLRIVRRSSRTVVTWRWAQACRTQRNSLLCLSSLDTGHGSLRRALLDTDAGREPRLRFSSQNIPGCGEGTWPAVSQLRAVIQTRGQTVHIRRTHHRKPPRRC
jgi:hypothetical protein